MDPYWVIVGGGVENTDTDREAALLREISEEIAGDAEILRLLHQLDNPKGGDGVLLPGPHRDVGLRQPHRPGVSPHRPRRVHPRGDPAHQERCRSAEPDAPQFKDVLCKAIARGELTPAP
ncbi:NUDIX domain-containing protein [Kitasatospora sp. NPDC007106]|uniref:NUDIX domain-containing protein n=1 Tax=Kitasatospora sp. NPDC007106 TaxID=3156914 RepID=UPI0033E604D1